MSMKPVLCLLVIIGCGWHGIAQSLDPAKKLGAFLGKWQTQGTFANGDEVASSLECRWSARQDFLVCEQVIKMAGGDHRQLTVYSYNNKDQTYSYTTIADPGARPTSGTLTIKDNVWTYTASFENGGKTVQFRTTNEFTTPGTEIFKVESSDDGGVTWKKQLQGSAHKTGE